MLELQGFLPWPGRVTPRFRQLVPGFPLLQPGFDLMWGLCHWGVVSPSSSLSLANFHSTSCSMLINHAVPHVNAVPVVRVRGSVTVNEIR